jgi:hypothetical protein
MLARGLLALLARFGLGLMALILLALALLGFLTLFRTLLLRHRLDGGNLLGSCALGGLALTRVGERTRARVLLLLGELRQHDTGTIGLSFVLNGLGSRRLCRARCGLCLGLLDRLRGRPAPSDRRFFFSTRTDFERPWLKL